MIGRIETYIHSDKSTPNKGGALVRVLSQTDFAAKTVEFIDFAKRAARLAYAAEATDWIETIEVFPDVETARLELEKQLKEKVTVDLIRVITL